MEAWIRALFSILPGPLRLAASLIVTGLIRVWQWSEGLARRLRVGWRFMVNGALRIYNGVRRLADEITTTLRWVILVRIPQLANWALQWAIRWTVDRLNWMAAHMAGLVDVLRRWVVSRVRDLWDTIRAHWRWITDRIAYLWDAARRLVAHVFGALATPERLARWIVGAMWTALWRLAYGQLDRIAGVLWHARRRLALRTLTEAERILARIL